MGWIIIAITWVITGILSFFVVCVIDMRGQAYDKHYLDDCFGVFMAMIVMGYISPIIIIIVYILKNDPQEYMTQLLYKIANIGLKKEGEESDLSPHNRT